MATKTYNTASFIEKLLAPLPAGEKQPNDRKFMLELERDRARHWEHEEKKLETIRLKSSAAFALYRANNLDQSHLRECHSHQDRATVQIKRMMLLPAPGRRELRWKQGLMKCHGSAEAEAMFARDVERLGPIPAPKSKAPKKGF